MNIAVDLLVVLVVVVAAVQGWRQGLSGFGFRLAGLVAGALLGWRSSSWVAQLVHPAADWRWAVTAGTVLVLALVGGALGAAIGGRLGALLTRLHLRLPDRIAGSLARGALALAVCWLIAGLALAVAPANRVTDAVRDSRVLGGVTAELGPPADALDRVGAALR